MPTLKRIKISMGGRGRKGRERASMRSLARPAAEVEEEDLSKLELETLYMIGAPAS